MNLNEFEIVPVSFYFIFIFMHNKYLKIKKRY